MSARAWRGRRTAVGKLAKLIVKNAREEADEERDLSGCPYYRYYIGQGPRGVCGYGCHEEPACVTDEPLFGWPLLRIRHANEIADQYHADFADDPTVIKSGWPWTDQNGRSV